MKSETYIILGVVTMIPLVLIEELVLGLDRPLLSGGFGLLWFIGLAYGDVWLE